MMAVVIGLVNALLDTFSAIIELYENKKKN